MNQLTLEEYLQLPYTIEVIRDSTPEDPGWVARVVELPGCMTQADTFDELGEMIEDAMRGWIGTSLEDGLEIPEPRPIETYSGKFIVRVPRSLHRMLAETAERENVSLNAYVSSALGLAVGQASRTPALATAAEPVRVFNWDAVSAQARHLLHAHGLHTDLQRIDEGQFAAWLEAHLDQAQVALEDSDYPQAQQYLAQMKQALNELSTGSPLLRSYQTAVAALEKQTEKLQRLHTGWLDQEELLQRALSHQQKMAQTLQERRAEYSVSRQVKTIRSSLVQELFTGTFSNED